MPRFRVYSNTRCDKVALLLFMVKTEVQQVLKIYMEG